MLSLVALAYNPWYLVDAVEAIGHGAILYIEKYSDDSTFSSLLVYPMNWIEDSDHA